ncbi:UNVERIFIED_CONTAM: hypothetical protein Sradi_2148400 [Sesamum radiatum]|uniref:DUF4283 domain-containing protein n=1 Tax=Sesamum radiatum TaxID=300843 RepID=A0AAW2TN08_SESRA
MRVFKWSPTFIPDQESSVVPVWVSFPDLPAHLFRKDALHSIAKFVGVPLQIADSTFSRPMLSRARICIEIDLLKPLVKEFDLQINGRTFVQKVEYEQVPQYCSLCKHVGHQDSECYTKGNAPKPRRRVFGTNEAKQMKEKTVIPNDPPASKEKGECSKTNESCPLIVDESDEHAIDEVDVAHDAQIIDVENETQIIDVMSENDACFVENETLVEHATVYKIQNENEIENVECFGKEPSPNDDCAFGALILRPDNFLCDLKKRTSWFKVDNALRIFDNFKQFGKVMKVIETDVEKVIKRNGLAIHSAILFQKCVLIFDRVSQLYLKPLDVRSPPIATRTRNRKKGKNLTKPPDIHYF